ncbi:MAG: BlaI/MecI/CopY family transcriptional regulator [Ruminococcus sp.]|nr:BlaI/MecI/CopY family transcriptional regulator [Ruminococcus sp.]
MKETKLGVIEAKFADIIWKKEPIATAELIKICEKEFGWKRTTTYTVLKRLSDKGIFAIENATVSAILSRDEYYAKQSESFVEETFEGSLPAFLAAFTSKRKLSKKEVDEIKKMIDNYGE